MSKDTSSFEIKLPKWLKPKDNKIKVGKTTYDFNFSKEDKESIKKDLGYIVEDSTGVKVKKNKK